MKESNPLPIRYVLSRIAYLGFATAAVGSALQLDAENNRTSFPPKRSKRSVWKRLRRQGRNAGGYAQR